MYKRRYRLSRKAIKDLQDMWSFARNLDPSNADAVLKNIGAKLDFACVYPHNGAMRPEIHDNARIMIDGPINIMYEVQENDLLIVGIVHTGLHPN